MTVIPSELVEPSRAMLGVVGGLRSIMARYPLGTARLWHRDDPARSSQRRAFTEGIADDVHYVRGGKGSGKTEAAAQIIAACARGRRDPEVQAWARANGMDLRHIPMDPTLILAVAPSHSISRLVHRPLLRRYLPVGTEYQYWDANVEAIAELPNGCKLRCMASNQTIQQFAAMNAQTAWVDEECDQDTFDEIRSRVARARWIDRTGWILLTATPITAMLRPERAWIRDRFEIERPEGYSSAVIRGSDNPYLDRAARERLLASLKDDGLRGMEEEGAFRTPGGLVYSRFNRRIHVVPPRAIPAEWVRRGGLDIGTAAPTAYLASAYDPEHDQIHVYGAHYARELTEREHAGRIQQVHADLGDIGPPPGIIADTQTPDAEVILTRYAEHGLTFTAAIKTFHSGLAAVQDRLEVRQRGRSPGERPGLVIHDTEALRPSIREIEALAWNPKRLHSDGYGPTATRGPDHACDALRYLCLHYWLALRSR